MTAQLQCLARPEIWVRAARAEQERPILIDPEPGEQPQVLLTDPDENEAPKILTTG